MDAFLAIASKRDERRYADRPVADEHVERILDAGRLSGSSRNTQNWQFVVVSDQARVRSQDRFLDIAAQNAARRLSEQPPPPAPATPHNSSGRRPRKQRSS